MPSAPPTTYSFLAREVADRGAAGFVHVADRADPTLRYLTRYAGPPDTRYAFVFVDEAAFLCAPPGDADRAGRAFAGRSVVDAADQTAETPGERAAEVLAARDATGTVLVPPHVPHDAAVYLERAGYDLASTDAVDLARAEKPPAARTCIAHVQHAAADGVAAAERLLAAASVEGRELRVEDAALTTERVRRAVNAALADAGVTDAENTVVAASTAATRRRFQGDLPVRPGTPVVVAVRPRGPHGYHGFLARTFTPASEGGWDRRAHLAATRALDAGLAEVADGVDASTVAAEVDAELTSFGFDPAGDSGFTGHGVGLATRERPLLTAGRLAAGHALAVGARAVDPAEGAVWVGDVAFVADDGVEVPADVPTRLVPERP